MKKLIMAAAIVFLLLTPVFQAAAMPPHPDNTKPTGRERPAVIDENSTSLYKSLSKSSSMLKSSSLATDYSAVNVLVLLVDYGADVAGTLPVYTDDEYSSGKTVVILFFALIAIFLLIAAKSVKWILPLGAFLLTISSCPSEGSSVDYGDPLYFKTSKTVFSGILNNEDVDMTMANYYYRMSNGNMTLSFDVKGPYRVSKGWQYYGANDLNGYDVHPGELVGEAVKLAKASGVDFSAYTAVDERLPTVIVVHAGQGEENKGDEDTIWSHNWDLDSAAAYGDGDGSIEYDGVIINNYTIQPEYNEDAGDATIGVFCHEFGHVLGLPDLYDTSYDTNGVGRWSLMGGGSWGSEDGTDPAPLLAWERNDIGGADWMAITEAPSGTNSLNDIEDSTTAYKITLDSGTGQYLLFERKIYKETGVDPYVPDSGLLVTHIHGGVISSYRGTNKVNDGSSRVHGVNIVENSDTTSYGTGTLWTSFDPDHSEMLFSSSRTINTSSTPNTNYYTSALDVESKTGPSGVTVTIGPSSFTATF